MIEFAIDRWDKLHPQAGRLEHFITPRWLAAERLKLNAAQARGSTTAGGAFGR